MAESRRITVAPSAVLDLEDIRAWYDDQGVPETGERLVRELIAHIESLAQHPERGRVVPEVGNAQVREIIHPPYRIVYRLDPVAIRVVRVWRGERVLQVPPA